MCKWYCTSSGPSTNLACLTCGCRYCGACLHGEAGKMASLIKCGRCGKKPGVKSNTNRGPWSAVTSPPCDVSAERAGSFVDSQLLETATTSFTSGLRASGAQESDHVAQKRAALSAEERVGSSSAAAVVTRPLRGPERFFYDKSSYTGTHARGGPEHVPKGAGTTLPSAWKRPDVCIDDRHSLDIEDVRSPSLEAGPTLLSGKSPAQPSTPRKTPARPSSRGAVSLRPSSCGAVKRAGSRGVGCGRLVGPERFFYDKSSYTGTHANGGPSSVAKGGGTSVDQSWKRVN